MEKRNQSITAFLCATLITACGPLGSPTSKSYQCMTNGDTCHAEASPGRNGTDGQDGSNGRDGVSGAVGTNGATGSQGPSGPVGSAGANGTSCSIIEVPGGVEISCTDGTSGTVLDGTDGTNGQNGSIGPSGAPGPQGLPGLPGTVITPVEFCPAQGMTTYPNHFPEYGLCIGGVIYAVYWDSHAENAWLAEVVPGTYRSTATGLGCTFVVTSNCGIQ